MFLTGLSASGDLTISGGKLTDLQVDGLPLANSGSLQPTIPFFPAGNDSFERKGILRISNLSDQSGEVAIAAYDDAGNQYGPIHLMLEALRTVELTSHQLENGSPNNGLLQGLGQPAKGDWRIQFTSELDLSFLSFVQFKDGSLAPMHDVVPNKADMHEIAHFTGNELFESNSILRLINPHPEETGITIRGFDDTGASSSLLSLTLPPHAATTLDSATLENGRSDLNGRLGNGVGSWRLIVQSNPRVLVMNLLSTPKGTLTNASTRPVPQHDDTSDAAERPRVYAYDVDEFSVFFDHTVAADAEQSTAFDILYRLNATALWHEVCATVELTPGKKHNGIFFTLEGSDIHLSEGSTVQARFRARDSAFCNSGLSATWSVIGESDIIPGPDMNDDTIADATQVAVPSTTDSAIWPEKDVDYYRVAIKQAGKLTVETTGSTWTAGRLLDGSETELAKDTDTSGAGNNFKIEEAVKEGTYYVEVSGGVSVSTGNYTLGVDFKADNGTSNPDTDLHGNNSANSTKVAIPSKTDGGIFPSGDVDWFTFELEQAGTITLESTSSFDVEGRLLNSNEDEVAKNSDSGSSLNFKIEEEVPAGTYFVEVSGWRTATGNYTLNVDFKAKPDNGGGDDSKYCKPNLVVQPGNRCDIYGKPDHYFEVRADGVGCYRAPGVALCSGARINNDGGTIGGHFIVFVAAKNDDNSWTISKVEPSPP